MTTKQTSGKSPYEIRLELLQMAQEHLQTTFKMQMDFATKALSLAKDSQWQTAEQLKAMMPIPYSIEDIMSKATELYSFVQKKG